MVGITSMDQTKKSWPARAGGAGAADSREPEFHAVQKHIGQALKDHYELSPTLPHSLFTLLMQLTVADMRRKRRRGTRNARSPK
jgi:hypothetical protein